MLPNRTYNELNESCFSQSELSEEAKLRAGLSARKNRRSSLQLTADRKALIAIYKKMQEREEQWGALEALFRDFYIVERVLNDCDERPKRLPVLLHGSVAGRWKHSGKRQPCRTAADIRYSRLHGRQTGRTYRRGHGIRLHGGVSERNAADDGRGGGAAQHAQCGAGKAAYAGMRKSLRGGEFHGNSKKRGCPAGEDKGTGAAGGDYRQAESRGGSGAVRMPVWHDEGARRRDSGADKRKAAAGG